MELLEGMIIGIRTPEWGHTWITEHHGWFYALRSLAEGSKLVIYDRTGKEIGEWDTPGKHSCHIRIYNGRAVICDYTSGSMGIWNLDGKGLPCGEVQMRYFQSCSHIHSSWVSPTDGKLTVADLGADCLYRFNEKLSEFETFPMPKGCGPRHCAFSSERLYVSTEKSDEVLVLEYPSMNILQRLEVNPEHPGGGAHIVLSRDNHTLYVSSRLENDGIAVFRVDPDGLLTFRGYCHTGLHPRHFSLRQDGIEMAVACRDSNLIEFYSIDPDTGMPVPGNKPSMEVASPVFVDYI